MDIDFPAAHSQDTEWFAVDKDGHVGLFFTCEDGHLPRAVARIVTREGAIRTQGQNNLLRKLWDLRQQSGTATADDPERYSDLDREDRASCLGLFYYKHSDVVLVGSDQILIGRYNRLLVPKEPIHVDQLPADLRTDCQTVRFDKATFAGNEQLQPLDDHSCTMWNPEGAIAYLSADGTTVRPTPGHEDQFADFCAKLLEEYPKFAAQLRFEAPSK